MARTPLPPGELKKLFNCKLPQDAIDRLKIICFRRSVHSDKKFSEGAHIEELIDGFEMPRKPTEEEVAAYIAKYPNKREELMALAKMPVPKRGRQ